MLVDDDPDVLEGTALVLKQHGWQVAAATTPDSAMDALVTLQAEGQMPEGDMPCALISDHRLGLDNGVMIKDNHIAVCGSIQAAVARARKVLPVLTKLEVECDRLEQVRQALDTEVDVIMLDNMSLADMKAAVELVAGRVKLEASGGVDLTTVRPIAETGVDVISVGALTHSAPVLDIGLDAL